MGNGNPVTVEMRSGGEAGAMRPALVLTFAPGSRPDRASVAAAIEGLARLAISHDPATTDRPLHAADPLRTAADGADWLELVVDGLTFDLVGLAPGAPVAAPDVAYRYNCEIDSEIGGEAIALLPGPHIVDGTRTLPVLRTLLGLAADLVQALPGVETVGWSPARSAIAPQFFTRTIRAWLEGGPFPALGVLGLWFDPSGALRSEGLAFLIGAELRVDSELTTDRAKAMRLAVRVVHELVGAQLPDAPQDFVTEEGEYLVLDPDPAARVIEILPARA